MWLIDADILIAILQTELNKGVYVKNTLETFIEVLQQCPTAYNVEKVVAELNKESYQEFCDSPRIADLKDAIDIVRRGGVEWRLMIVLEMLLVMKAYIR